MVGYARAAVRSCRGGDAARLAGRVPRLHVPPAEAADQADTPAVALLQPRAGSGRTAARSSQRDDGGRGRGYAADRVALTADAAALRGESPHSCFGMPALSMTAAHLAMSLFM